MAIWFFCFKKKSQVPDTRFEGQVFSTTSVCSHSRPSVPGDSPKVRNDQESDPDLRRLLRCLRAHEVLQGRATAPEVDAPPGFSGSDGSDSEVGSNDCSAAVAHVPRLTGSAGSGISSGSDSDSVVALSDVRQRVLQRRALFSSGFAVRWADGRPYG